MPPFIAIVLLLARLLYDFGAQLGLVDKPNHRSSHTKIVPRVGGISIFIPYLVLGLSLYMWNYGFIENNSPYWFSLAAIVLLGMIDDRLNLGSGIKFLIQFGAAAYYVIYSGNYVDSLHGLFGVGALPAWLGIALSITAVVYLTNAVNLIDGVDGLAAGTSMVSLSLFAMLMQNNQHTFTLVYLSLGLAVFLGFNFSKNRKIFLGDAGSLGLGFVLATMAMEFLHTPNGHTQFLNINPVVCAVLILGYPVLDTLRVFSIRLANGTSPFSADRRHIHHVMLDKGFSHFGVTSFIMTNIFFFTVMNKVTAPFFNAHLSIFVNGLCLLLVHLLVRHRSYVLRKHWRIFSRFIMNPIKRAWTRYVDID